MTTKTTTPRTWTRRLRRAIADGKLERADLLIAGYIASRGNTPWVRRLRRALTDGKLDRVNLFLAGC